MYTFADNCCIIRNDKGNRSFLVKENGMTTALKQRKEQIVDLLRRGLPEDTAFRCALLSPSEREQIEQDEEYQKEKEYVYAMLESELMAGLYKAALAGCERGNSGAAERMLELINPAKYGKQTKIDVSSSQQQIGQITVNYV